MKKPRSREQQTVALARVAAGIALQQHRPKVHKSKTAYDRNKGKRLWQKDQEALTFCYTDEHMLATKRMIC